MKTRVWLKFLIAMVPSLALAQGMAGGRMLPADLILYNGKVVTVDANFTITEAVAQRGDKILAVGKNDEILRLANASTRKIDLKGKMVIPGIIDTHSHVHSYARGHYGQELGAENLREYPINWAAVKTKNDFLTQIDQMMKRYKFKPGEWVFFPASNYSESGTAIKIFYEELTAADLDKVTPNNPVVLSIGGGTIIFDGVGMVNGKAWEILWMQYGDFIKKYGRYWKDSSGKPTGLIEPPASKIVQHELLPRPSAENLAPILRKELEEWSAMGITTVATRMGAHDVAALKMLDEAEQLKVRIPYGNEDFFAVKDPDAVFTRMGNVIGIGSSKLWLISFTPLIVDGSGSRGATDQKRLTEYGPDGQYFPIGISLLDPEYRGATGDYYKDWFFALARNGGRLANMHTQGDRSARRMLDILEEINQEVPLKERRWALDHCTLINPQDIPRSAELGVYWSCAPKYVENGPTIEKVYGDKVAQTFLLPLKTLLDKGAKVVLQMDRHQYIWGDLELALTRKVEGKVYGPQDRIDKITGLRMLTSWAAEYVLRERELGSLEPGKKADLTVLDRDYLTIPDEEVSEVQALMTICDGEIVHVHPRFSEEYQLKPEGAVIATYQELARRR
ncbi:MAG: amidohydrolase family protein [Acidobacteria bacterium]|nr:amidohydrolase family protein [Acidobacteriota bacterium]